MAIILEGGTSGVDVDSTANKELLVALQATETDAGFASVSSEIDSGDVIGSRDMRSIEVGQDYRLRVGVDSIVFSRGFPGTAVHTGIWNTTVTTMTLTVAGGNANLNAGLSTASGAVARLSSYQTFPIYGSMGTLFAITLQRTQAPVTNNVCEWGAQISTGTSAPTDGAFFRLGSDGSFKCVTSNNGTESTSADLVNYINGVTANYWPVDTAANFQIVFGADFVYFWLMPQGLSQYPRLMAKLARPAGFGHTMSQSLPIVVREYNSAATGAAQSLKVAQMTVIQVDAENSSPIHVTNAVNGKHIYQAQEGGTMGSLANYANSANPTAAVPTNTTAALGTGLGGQFWETDTLAVTTDGIISSYQNPAAASTQPGQVVVITGVKISSYVQTVLTGGGYNAVWSLAFGSSGLSLATTDGAGTKAPRRIALGNQTVASAAAALTLLQDVSFTFPEGIPVYPGEYIQTVKKKVGTAPSAGVIAHTITFSGYVL